MALMSLNTNCDYINKHYCWQEMMRLKCLLKNKNFTKISIFVDNKQKGDITDELFPELRESYQDYTSNTQWAQSGLQVTHKVTKVKVRIINSSLSEGQQCGHIAGKNTTNPKRHIKARHKETGWEVGFTKQFNNFNFLRYMKPTSEAVVLHYVGCVADNCDNDNCVVLWTKMFNIIR